MKRILEIQKEIGVLSKKSENPFFKSAYLGLDDLLKHVTPMIHDKDLILVQPIINGAVCSQIIDSLNGECLLSSAIPLPDLKDPQKIGSCITYFRRYTLKKPNKPPRKNLETFRNNYNLTKVKVVITKT